jgi:hypothetical protein
MFGEEKPSRLRRLPGENGQYSAIFRGNPVRLRLFGERLCQGGNALPGCLPLIGVPSVKVLGRTERCLCLEDPLARGEYHLADEKDLSSPQSAALLARWLRLLHRRGEGLAPGRLFLRGEALRPEALFALWARYPAYAFAWKTLLDYLPALRSLERQNLTLCYNAFDLGQILIKNDGSEVLFLEQPQMALGARAFDRLLLAERLHPRARAAFLREYGPIEPCEAALAECLLPLLRLAEGAGGEPGHKAFRALREGLVLEWMWKALSGSAALLPSRAGAADPALK